jgi:hypothetical protein
MQSIYGTNEVIFHWLFITGTLILCVVAAMPTRGWLALGSWVKNGALKRKQKRLEDALAAMQQPFRPDVSFLDRGVGLAVDHAHRLVFLAMPDGAQMRAEILPATALGAHQARTKLDNGFQEHVVEIAAPGSARPFWRLICDDAALADEVNGALAQL